MQTMPEESISEKLFIIMDKAAIKMIFRHIEIIFPLNILFPNFSAIMDNIASPSIIYAMLICDFIDLEKSENMSSVRPAKDMVALPFISFIIKSLIDSLPLISLKNIFSSMKFCHEEKSIPFSDSSRIGVIFTVLESVASSSAMHEDLGNKINMIIVSSINMYFFMGVYL